MHIFASRSREHTVDLVAQLVEQYTFNVWALGSSPNGITKPSAFCGRLFFFGAAFESLLSKSGDGKEKLHSASAEGRLCSVNAKGQTGPIGSVNPHPFF